MATKRIKKTVAGGPSDPTGGTVSFQIGGDTYHANWDFNALALAESLTGVNLFSGVLDFKHVTATQFKGLLFAALAAHHPRITLEGCGALVTPQTIYQITNVLLQAWAGVQPEEIEKAEESENPQSPDETL